MDWISLGGVGATLRMSARWAVPFFFNVSGYFASSKTLSITDPARRTTIRKLLFLTAFANLLYLPYAWKLGLIPLGSHWPDILIWWIPSGFAFHLWFLHSLLVGHVVISLGKTRNACIYSSYALGLLVLVLTLLWNHSGTGDIAGIFLRLMSIVPFLAAGILLRRCDPGPRTGWAFVMVGMATQFAQFFWMIQSGTFDAVNSTEIFYGTPLLGFGIAALAIRSHKKDIEHINDPLKRKIYPIAHLAGHMGSTYVLGIYVIHIYVRIAINGASRFLSIYDQAIFRLLSPLLILIASACLIHLLYKTPRDIRRFVPL